MANTPGQRSISDHPLYASIRGQLPGDVPNDKAEEITLRALQNGILGPDALQRAQVHDERIVAVGAIPGYQAMVGLNAPAPSAERLNAEFSALVQAAAPQVQPPAPTLTEPRVNLRVGAELNEEQRTALGRLNTSIQDVTRVLNGIPNEARMTLADGRTVSGEELRDMWSKTEFNINPTGYSEYKNESGRGEADYNGGDPRISYNLDLLTDYSKTPGGTNFLVLHELGHMTVAGRETNEQVHRDKTLTDDENEVNERLANDVARGIAAHGRLEVLPPTGTSKPTMGGYSPEVPPFNTPIAAPAPALQPDDAAPAPRR